MQNLPFNKNILWLIAVFISSFIGMVVGATYPTWYQKLPFKEMIPEFLRPVGANFQFSTDDQKLIRTIDESAIIKVVDKASPAVVSIVASTVSLDPVEGVTKSQQGIGTGFIVRSDGVILTASHVVSERGVNYKVVTNDEKTYEVKKIEPVPSLDFAILKIDAKNLPTLTLADSDAVRVGQEVIAIGNALGRFTNSVTRGIISGIGRGIAPSNALGVRQETLENAIQTDAALNPGNSGGPLLDLGGAVIGINFATTVGAENIGFVIPTNSIRPILEEYYSKGRIVRPFLGVSYVFVDKSSSLLQGLPQGAYITMVMDGYPAQKAGLRPADIITRVGNQELGEDNTLAKAINKFKVGDSVDIELWRDGEIVKTKAKLVEAPN